MKRLLIVVLPVAVSAFPSPANGQTIRYVDDDAPPGGNGFAWQTAFDNLQQALATAEAGDEIRVAQGVYGPAPPDGDREATFQLIDGVALRGGYAGITEPVRTCAISRHMSPFSPAT